MMDETLYIYIGADDSRKMQGLEVAMRTKYVQPSRGFSASDRGGRDCWGSARRR
jgi:hypothetical protein